MLERPSLGSCLPGTHGCGINKQANNNVEQWNNPTIWLERGIHRKDSAMHPLEEATGNGKRDGRQEQVLLTQTQIFIQWRWRKENTFAGTTLGPPSPSFAPLECVQSKFLRSIFQVSSYTSNAGLRLETGIITVGARVLLSSIDLWQAQPQASDLVIIFNLPGSRWCIQSGDAWGSPQRMCWPWTQTKRELP